MSELIAVQPATVYVIDAEPRRAESTRALLKNWGLRSESFPTAEEFLKSAPGTRPGCLLVEHPLQGVPANQLQQRLAARGERLPIVVVCDSASVRDAVDYLSNGAFTLLEKPCEEAKLRATIEAAIAADVSRLDTDRRYRELQRFDEALTDRERLVLQGIVSGKLNKAMAKQLDVSTRTIEAVRAKIYEKYRVVSAAELASKTTELRVLTDLVYKKHNAPLGFGAPSPVNPAGRKDSAWFAPVTSLFQISL